MGSRKSEKIENWSTSGVSNFSPFGSTKPQILNCWFYFSEEKRQPNSINHPLTPRCAGVSTKDVFSHTDYSHCGPFVVTQ